MALVTSTVFACSSFSGNSLPPVTTNDGGGDASDASAADANRCAVDASGCVEAGAPARATCKDVASRCGSGGVDECCSANLVGGGTFNRFNDGAYPATVSEFRMDNYEITVGRFRRFVASYPGSKPANGSGRNRHNSGDLGWQAAWTALLPADGAALTAVLQCDLGYLAFKTVAGAEMDESRPLNCLSWFEAQAFCIWDGGRLPTEAEWNYAAAGGSEQRLYPWSSPPTDPVIGQSYASYDPAGRFDCLSDGVLGCSVGDLLPVGSKAPKGNGRWGQADLAGNVWEWTQDAPDPIPSPCNDCAQLATDPDGAAIKRALRGGSFFDSATDLSSFYRLSFPASQHTFDVGARCVRDP